MQFSDARELDSLQVFWVLTRWKVRSNKQLFHKLQLTKIVAHHVTMYKVFKKFF